MRNLRLLLAEMSRLRRTRERRRLSCIHSIPTKLYRELLEGKVFKAIGTTPAPAVTKDDVVRVLNKIDADRQADLVKNAIGSTFKWGMKRGEVNSNPCEGLGPRAALGVRERVLTDHELRTLWHAADRDDIWISQGMRAIIRLCLVTGLGAPKLPALARLSWPALMVRA
jgi:hypothetical protein